MCKVNGNVKGNVEVNSKLKNQVKIYSLDTKAFYTKEENEKNDELIKEKVKLKNIEQYLQYQFLKGEDLISTLDEHIEKLDRLSRLLYLKNLYGALSLEQEKEIENIDEELININKHLHEIRSVICKDKPRKNRNKEKEEGKKYYKLREPQYRKFRDSNDSYKKVRNNKNALNKELTELIKKNKESKDMRVLNESALKIKSKISIFESSLTRTLAIKTDELSLDIMVVRVYHYDIMYKLITEGFKYNNEDYIFFTSSAGQIRQKKLLMMKKSVYEKFEKTFMCGLTKEMINEMGGMNNNKFLSYLALNSSGTNEMVMEVQEILNDEIDIMEDIQEDENVEEIKGFNIDRCIVIPDFKTKVKGIVDYISKKEVEKKGKKFIQLLDNIERKETEIDIPHGDGCGWVLSTVSKVNKMIRLPWVKGLVASNNYILWCEKFNDGKYTITDIDGRVWDLKKDKIEYVFTKSQFKLWKFYQNDVDENKNVIKYGWDKYKEAFKTYNCKANFCNEEPKSKKGFKKARFNYQMMQTLIDITDEEIKAFTDPAIEYIKSMYTDKDVMLKELKADDTNKHPNNFQKILKIYPELLKDAHVKNEIANKIASKKDEYKSAKLPLNAYYTFIIPDLFCWMQYAFYSKEVINKMIEEKKQIGLLEDGEVSCKLFEAKELIVERSPHLYIEHTVRNNINNDLTNKWLPTNAIYVSCKDLISKILMFDVDGDCALVIDEPTKLLPIVKRNIGYDLDFKNDKDEWNYNKIVPLAYEMGKAEANDLSGENFYKNLVSAFKSSNIGKYSNQLTKLWSNTKKCDNLKLHALITAGNNFSIDSAKTLLSACYTYDIEEQIKNIEKEKLPYFFMFAKDKEEYQVNELGTGTVDRIVKEIESIKGSEKFDFSKVGRFNYKTLMNDSKIEINDNIIEAYKEIDEEKNNMFKSTNMEKYEISKAIYETMMIEFEIACIDNGITYNQGADMVIKYMFTKAKSERKTAIFEMFGEFIINNLNNNIKKDIVEDNYITCEICGKRVKAKSNSKKMCKPCSDKKIKERDRLRKSKKK